MSKRTSDDAELTPIEAEASTAKRANVSPEAASDANNNTVLVGTASAQGERDSMQDRHVVQADFRPQVPVICDISRLSYFGVFDGHAGSAASDFCSGAFTVKIPKLCTQYAAPTNTSAALQKSVKKIFVNAFKEVEDEFLTRARSSRPALKDGTTATILLLIDDYLYTANVGDSRAVLARKKVNDKGETCYLAMPLTVDHTPMKAEEQARIRKAGGFVKDGRVQGVIEVARSIGDFAFKAYGVCAQPDIQKVSLSLADKFVILACDGLWKVFTSEEAVNFVVKKLRAGISRIDDTIDPSLASKRPTYNAPKNPLLCSIAADLTKAALDRGCGDNVSIVLIGFREALNDL